MPPPSSLRVSDRRIEYRAGTYSSEHIAVPISGDACARTQCWGLPVRAGAIPWRSAARKGDASMLSIVLAAIKQFLLGLISLAVLIGIIVGVIKGQPPGN